MSDEAAEQLAGVVMTCAYAIIDGSKKVTITVRGIRPPGFPKGELLSVGTNGAKNYAFDPLKVLAWVQSKTRVVADSAQQEQKP